MTPAKKKDDPRPALVAERRRVLDELHQHAEQSAVALEEAAELLAQAHQALEAARLADWEARAADARKSTELERRLARVEAELAAGAPPAIAELERDCQRWRLELLAAGESTAFANLMARPAVLVLDRSREHGEALESLSRAMGETLPLLRYSAVPASEVEAKVDALRAELERAVEVGKKGRKTAREVQEEHEAAAAQERERQRAEAHERGA